LRGEALAEPQIPVRDFESGNPLPIAFANSSDRAATNPIDVTL